MARVAIYASEDDDSNPQRSTVKSSTPQYRNATEEHTEAALQHLEPEPESEPEFQSAAQSEYDEDPAEPVAKEQPVGIKINRNDPPQAGSIYIINESTTSKVITNDNGKITLTDFTGEPTKAQRWVCQRSGNWLGFTNDAGTETTYLGHDIAGILICTATLHLAWENFTVTKRKYDGFDVMLRHWFGSQPLGYRNQRANLGKTEVTDTWWGFTKVA